MSDFIEVNKDNSGDFYIANGVMVAKAAGVTIIDNTPQDGVQGHTISFRGYPVQNMEVDMTELKEVTFFIEDLREVVATLAARLIRDGVILLAPMEEELPHG